MQWGTRTESEAKPEQYLKQLTTKHGMHTNLSEQTHPRGYQLQEHLLFPRNSKGWGVAPEREQAKREEDQIIRQKSRTQAIETVKGD